MTLQWKLFIITFHDKKKKPFRPIGGQIKNFPLSLHWSIIAKGHAVALRFFFFSPFLFYFYQKWWSSWAASLLNNGTPPPPPTHTHTPPSPPPTSSAHLSSLPLTLSWPWRGLGSPAPGVGGLSTSPHPCLRKSHYGRPYIGNVSSVNTMHFITPAAAAV